VGKLLGRHSDLRLQFGTLMYRQPDGRHAWQTFINGHGPTRMLAASRDNERRAALQRDFAVFPDGFADALGATVPRGHLVTLATRR
jgi:hypothetical protein